MFGDIGIHCEGLKALGVVSVVVSVGMPGGYGGRPTQRRIPAQISQNNKKSRIYLTRKHFNDIIIIGGVQMTGREIIRDIMSKEEITNSILANRLGITQAALWDRIDTQPRKGKPRKDIPVSLLAEMLRMMDYKVVVLPKSARVSEEGYVID